MTEAIDPLGAERPSAARVYDYMLGGAHNFQSDRQMAQEVLRLYPEAPLIAQANRAFLHRAVRFLLGQGVRQFLDLGSGIPTAGNVHEVAQSADPGARVTYVDIDPVAVAYSEQILAGNQNASILQADLREPERILATVRERHLLDLQRPVALLLIASLPFVADRDDPAGIVATLRDAVAPGSYLGLSHGTPDQTPADRSEDFEEVYRSTANPVTLRSRAAIEALFAGWELVEPGLVWAPEWRPDWPDETGPDPSWCQVQAGVARKL